jgi:hypothetical protein
MSKIKTITELRDAALEMIDKLSAGQVEINEAMALGKLCDTVISTVKTQLEFAKMVNEEPQIPFLGSDQPRSASKLIESGKTTSKGIPYAALK